MFLGFQYPEEIPGVSVLNFLRTALSNRTGTDYTVLELRLKVDGTWRDPLSGYPDSPDICLEAFALQPMQKEGS